jgi:hypothetical protein
VVYAPYLGDYFVGGDTWAHIWTSRDIGQVLTQPIMAGSSFPETVARFYRPVSSLSYTLQYAMSGLNAFAFHLGDLLIHVLAMLGLCALAITLGIRPWAAALGVAVVALHPAMASVVPAAPRRHDSLVTIGLSVALIVVAWYVRLSPDKARPRTTPALIAVSASLAFAVLAKESGYIGMLLVLPTMLAALFGANISPRSRIRQIGLVLLVCTATTVGSLVWHAHVVGGLGGYGPLSPFTDLDTRVDELVQILLWPFRDNLQTYLKAWLIELSVVLFVVGLPIALIHRKAAATLILGWVWLLVSATFELMSESTAPWQAYVTLAAFGLMIAAVLDGAATAWTAATESATDAPHSQSFKVAGWLPRSRPVALVAQGVLAACVLGLVIFSAGVVRDSALLTAYPEWHTSARVAQSYLAAVQGCIDTTPPGRPAVLADWPAHVDDANDQSRLVMAGVFTAYSMAPAVYLTMNHPGLHVQALESELSVGASNRSVQATCSEQGGVWLVQAVYDPPLEQPHT